MPPKSKSSGKTTAEKPKKSSAARPRSSKGPPQTVSNATEDSMNFLFTGNSPEELEAQWLKRIQDLIEKKRSVKEQNKFSDNLQQLYNALLEDLCKRCGETFKAIFEAPQAPISEVQLGTVQKEEGNQVDLENELADAKLQIQSLNSSKQDLSTKLKEASEHATKLQAKETEMTKEIQNKANDIKKLKDQIDSLKKEIEIVKGTGNINQKNEQNVNVNVQLNLRINEKDQEIAVLKRENTEVVDDLKKSVDKLEKDNTRLRKELEDIKKSYEELRDIENKELKDKVKGLETSIESLKTSNADQEKNLESKNNEEMKRLTSENQRLMENEKQSISKLKDKDEVISGFENKIKVLTEENKSLNTVVAEINNNLEEEKRKLKKERQMAAKGPDQTIKELQADNDVLRDRLSQIAGSKMTDGNPAIADLGDPNRPTQLGEKFSELYDNEWTDAMEELEKSGDEKTNINTLRTIVERAYEFGKTRSGAFMKDLEKSLMSLSNSIQVTPAISRLIKELRKNIASLVTEGIYQAFLGNHTEFKVGGENVKSFIRKTVGLCWFMAIQDPPVVLTTKASGKLDTDRFRHYTKSGTTIDYVVWPVVYLHEGGPIICKGVAQGK